jgi:O-antigen/teichoic acid export membrane protein
MRLRLSPFMQDIVMTAFATAVTMVSLILITQWLARGLGPTEFGVWGLSRRVYAALTNVTTIPLGVALARGFALTDQARERRAILIAGVILAVVPNSALLLAGALLPGAGAGVLFHDPARGGLLLASLAGLVGTAGYTVVYARYRGLQQMRLANLWQLGAVGLGPLLVTWWLRDQPRADRVVLWSGLVPCAAYLPLLGWLWAARRAPGADVQSSLRDLLRYSIPRMPGGLAFGVLMALGPLLAPYFTTLADAGYLVAAQSALRIVEAATASFAVVALPKVASLKAGLAAEFVQARVEDLVALSLHLGLFATGQMILWSPEIVRVWLGEAYVPAIPIVRVMLIAVAPYLAYAVLRSVIDALEDRAVNAANIYAALGITLVLSLLLPWLGLGALGLSIAGAAGFISLGLLSVRHLWRSLGLRGSELRVGPVLGLNLTLGAVVTALRAVLPEAWGAGPRLLAGAGLAGSAALLYVAVLRQWGTRWIAEVELRVVHRMAGP